MHVHVTELRKLAEFCSFGTNLNDSLRDRFVYGLKAEHIQKRLLSEAALTFEKALEISQAMETAAKDATQLQSLQQEAAVHKFQKGRRQARPSSQFKQQKIKKSCYRCNGTNHTPDTCKFKDEICYACSKKGHIKHACLSKKQYDQKKKVQIVDKEEDSNSEFKILRFLRNVIVVTENQILILYGLHPV